MGRFLKGINGGFSGKIGNTIGSKWKGIDIMKSLSDRRNNKASEKQIIQRARFGFAMQFLQPIFPVINIGYRNRDIRQVPQNAAMKQVLSEVVEGTYPAFSINYPALSIAKGTLPVAGSEAVAIVGDEIEFTWKDQSNNTKNHGDNYSLMLAIGEGVYPTYSLDEFTRSNLGGVIELPHGPSGTVIHCYLAFHQETKGRVSNSKYIGSITLP